MKLQVKWQDLDMSRSSIMGLFDGKYINAVSQLGEEFFLGFGHDRHYNKIIFIQLTLIFINYNICIIKYYTYSFKFILIIFFTAILHMIYPLS